MTPTPTQTDRHSCIITLRRLCWVLIVALAAPQAFADGCAMPPVAVKKLPEIPTQRAVLTYRDGMERMVIESTFSGPGERLGWVIPVPAEPTRFESLPAGFAGQLEFVTRPIVKDANRRDNVINNHPILCGLACLMFCWVILALFKLRFTLALTLAIGLPLILIYFECFFGYRTFYGQSASENPGVQTSRQERVGNYTIETLKAKDAKALNEWLGSNGFMGLAPQGEQIVNRLIGSGWRFVTAKLQRKGTEPCHPHPIALTFPTKKLIYPMRLTALAGAPVYLEIFTVADRETSCPPLTREFCERFAELPGDYYAIMNDTLRKEFALLDHAAEKFGMWPECWVTRLTGTLPPEEMIEDLTFDWERPKPTILRYYTTAGAMDMAIGWMLLVWCSTSFSILLYFKAWNRIEQRRPFIISIMRCLAGTMLAGYAAFTSLPKTKAVLSRTSLETKYISVPNYFHLTDDIEGEEATRPNQSLAQLKEKFFASHRSDLEFIENADGSLDYLIHMPGGEPWGNRLRQPKKQDGDLSEEDLNNMLRALETK